MKKLNEEIDLIKYLLNYDRGRILSEQKNILLEQNKKDYDNIANQLSTTWSATLQKYGFQDTIKFYGTDAQGNLIEDYTTKPSVIAINLSSVYETGGQGTFETAFFACNSQVKFINPYDKTKVTAYDVAVNEFARLQPSGIDYRYSSSTGEKNDAKLNELRKTFTTTTRNIAKQICQLIDSLSKGEDVQPKLDAIAETEAKANQPKTQTQVKSATPATPAKPTTPTTNKSGQSPKPPVKVEGQIGQNNFTEPRFTVTYDSNYKKWIIQGFAPMVTNSAESGNFDDLLVKKIKEAIELQKKSDEKLRSNSSFITLTMAEVRGTASNYWGGKEIPYNAEFGQSWNTLNEVTPTSESGGFTSNVALANKRATEVLAKIKTELPKVTENGQKINVYDKLLKSAVKGYSVNSGGVCDSCPGRDWTEYPFPGQSIYVRLTIKLQGPPPDKFKSESCLKTSKIRIGYFPEGATINKGQKNHECDSATFDVYLNDKIIGTVDLGNGVLLNTNDCGVIQRSDAKSFCLRNANKNKNLSNTVTDGKIGGMRYAEFIITDSMAKEVNNSSKSGEVSIYLFGKDNSYYTGRGLRKFDGDEFTTHADTPWVQFYPNKTNSTTTIDEAPFGELPRCGGSNLACKKEFIMKFNPCGKDTLTTVMDSGVGEG